MGWHPRNRQLDGARTSLVGLFNRFNFAVAHLGTIIRPQNTTIALELQPHCIWIILWLVMHGGLSAEKNCRRVVEIYLAQEHVVLPGKVVEIQYSIQSPLIGHRSELAHSVIGTKTANRKPASVLRCNLVSSRSKA